ncbi:MAG: hypothetical protein KJ955_06525 [Nanoarchaeota archaeon]|nr:hypothetical protein [Nanoarchaeota archaeon]
MVNKKTMKGKKKWFTILASPEFSEQVIGETSAYEIEQLIGRTVVVNAGRLAAELRRQNAVFTFRVKGVQGQNASTEVVKYEIAPMLVKRLVKRERDKADDSFVVTTKDNIKVRVKPFFVTRGFAHNSLLTAIRLKARQIIADEAGKRSYSEFIVAVASSDLQKFLKAELKKLSPLAVAEIRVMQLVK